MIHLKRVLKAIFSVFGVYLVRVKTSKNRKGLNLNVGCGDYEINGFVSVDFFTQHYYKNKKFKRVFYDMRGNKGLPFNSSQVDNIYCSHVIEHIETIHVEKFIGEAYRVLKNNGVMRIACPDSKFLYQQMKFFPEYFNWHPNYQTKDDAIKCFVDEVATHKVSLPNYGLPSQVESMSYDELMDVLRKDGIFDVARPGWHINNWDYERLKSIGSAVGFNLVVESKCKGSSVPCMQGNDMDNTHPEMSLYVEFHKIN